MNIAARSCKASAENIVRILRPHSMAVDAEFLIVADAVLRTLKSLLSAPHLEQSAGSDLKGLTIRFADLLDGYSSHLERLHKDTQQLLRNLQSPRLQHALLIRNTLVFQELATIVDTANMLRPVAANSANESPPKFELAASTLPPPASTSAPDSSPEDPKASLFWLENWTSDDYIVTWQQFQSALATAFPMACLASFSSLQYLLDFSGTGVVSKTRFLGLTKLAPSFDEFVDFGTLLMRQLWFLGFLSKNEATMLLHQEPVGTFLIRLHKNARGTLVCSYVSHNRSVQHHIIQKDRLGFSMLNCAGVFSSLDEMINHSAFLKTPFSEGWIRSQHFLGDANREEADGLLEGLAPGTFAIRLQPTGCIPLSALQLPNMSAMTSHSSQKMSQFRDTSFVFSSVTTSGSVRHTYAPRDLKGRIIISGKAWDSVTDYLAENRTVFTTPLSPAHPRFRSRLDSQVIALVSPAPTRASARFTSGLSNSNSSLSSSTGRAPRSLRSTTSDSDITSSPAHSRDDISSPRNCHSPMFDEDAPIFEVGNLSAIQNDPPPFHSTNEGLEGGIGAQMTRNGLGSEVMPSLAPWLHSYSNPISADPTTRHRATEHRFPLNASLAVDYAHAMGNRAFGSREKRLSTGFSRPNSNNFASDSAPPGAHAAAQQQHTSSAHGGAHVGTHDHGSGIAHGVHNGTLLAEPISSASLNTPGGASPKGSRATIASSSAAIFAPSTSSSQFLPSDSLEAKTLAEHTSNPAGAPLASVKWTPLSDQEINPLSLSYKDIWADLLRYYHVPVPEAKLPPKTATSSSTHSNNAASSHAHSSKANGNAHPIHHSHGGAHNATSHISSRS